MALLLRATDTARYVYTGDPACRQLAADGAPRWVCLRASEQPPAGATVVEARSLTMTEYIAATSAGDSGLAESLALWWPAIVAIDGAPPPPLGELAPQTASLLVALAVQVATMVADPLGDP